MANTVMMVDGEHNDYDDNEMMADNSDDGADERLQQTLRANNMQVRLF